MKTYLKNNSFLQNLLFSALSLILFSALNSIAPFLPLSCSLYIGLLYAGVGILPLSASFILSFLVFKNAAFVLVGATFALLYGAIFYLYKVKQKKPSVETVIYTILGLAPYFLLNVGLNVVEKLVYTAIIGIFSFVSIIGAIGFFIKIQGATVKLSQNVCAAIVFIVCAVGAIKLFGINVVKPLSVGAFLLLSRYYKNPTATIWCGLLAIPLAIASKSSLWFSCFVLFYVATVLFKSAPALICALSLFATDLICGLVFKFYPQYGYVQAIPTAIFLFIAGLIPNSAIKSLREKYALSAEEKLTKEVIARQRSQTASKLYEISGVFYQMEDAFDKLKKCCQSTDVLIEKMSEETLYNMCATCAFRERCKSHGLIDTAVIEKIVRIGVAKGRVSIIDLSREFTEFCTYPNSIIYEVNRLIGQYYEYINQAENGDKSKEVLSLQARGVAFAMKTLAFELSKTMPENSTIEKRIVKNLLKLGISCESVMVFGDKDEIFISLTTYDDSFEPSDFSDAISYSVGYELTVTQKDELPDGSFCFFLQQKPPFDAIFGVSKITKAGSNACGDSHSLIKIDHNHFLIALADGMGSGETAEKTSQSALNLIEAFYKAGLDSEFILNMVNKLLSITIDDNFSAIDVALVNLKAGTTSFIKIGSPYGFILSKEGIRFVEGSSLPLGILDDLHPTTASADLKDGDVIILVSDGVTDSFGSSGDFVEFLKTAPLNNPQNLADEIVKRALFLCGGVAQDDMTALCVRLIEQTV